MTSQKNWLQQLAQENPRITGVFILLIGLVILYFSIAEPILHAEVGSRIELTGKGGVGGGIFAILGLVLILFGPRTLNSLQKTGSGSKIPVYLVAGILGVVGVISMALLKSHLRSKGYVL